jgi:hypothetical protein
MDMMSKIEAKIEKEVEKAKARFSPFDEAMFRSTNAGVVENQTKIDANKNQTNSNNKWQIISMSNQIEISLANFAASKKPVGKIEFYRPSNSKLDVMKDLDLNAEGKMFVSAQNFKTGPYIIKINYTIENKSYFDSQWISQITSSIMNLLKQNIKRK